jgi:hypothetical protein
LAFWAINHQIATITRKPFIVEVKNKCHVPVCLLIEVISMALVKCTCRINGKVHGRRANLALRFGFSLHPVGQFAIIGNKQIAYNNASYEK